MERRGAWQGGTLGESRKIEEYVAGLPLFPWNTSPKNASSRSTCWSFPVGHLLPKGATPHDNGNLTHLSWHYSAMTLSWRAELRIRSFSRGVVLLLPAAATHQPRAHRQAPLPTTAAPTSTIPWANCSTVTFSEPLVRRMLRQMFAARTQPRLLETINPAKLYQATITTARGKHRLCLQPRVGA